MSKIHKFIIKIDKEKPVMYVSNVYLANNELLT